MRCVVQMLQCEAFRKTATDCEYGTISQNFTRIAPNATDQYYIDRNLLNYETPQSSKSLNRELLNRVLLCPTLVAQVVSAYLTIHILEALPSHVPRYYGT